MTTPQNCDRISITKFKEEFSFMSKYKTSEIITKYPAPILSRHDVPYKSALTYNAGVIKENGKYIMLFRNDYGSFEEQHIDGINIGLAYSNDGVKWKVEPKPCFDPTDDEIKRAYDPRITALDGKYYVCFAADTRHGIRGGIAETTDFEKFDILSLSVPDNRNMALFPEKINGKYVRLERPMPIYGVPWRQNKFDIWLSESPDLVYWGNPKLVLDGDTVEFSNDKIGPGAPPVKTEDGWLTIFHSVIYDENAGKNGWEPAWKKTYYIGVMLLDLEDPSKVIGIYDKPLMVPDMDFELHGGCRNNALFPCGMIIDDNDEVKIYYSAGDAYVCLATAKLDDLIALCKGKK